MDQWLIVGEPSQTVRVTDRGLAYGDGLFETVAVRHRQCRFLDEHVERLMVGCESLKIPFPGVDDLRAEARSMAADYHHGTLKIIVTRGTGPRGYAPPEHQKPRRILGIERTDTVSSDCYEHGVRVRVCDTPVSRNPMLAGHKTLNRIEQVLARSEWTDPEIREGLMLDDRGHVVCGTMTNVFVVIDGVLHTPELSEAGVAGVMRRKIIEQCRSAGIEIKETVIRLEDLQAAPEIFLSNAVIGIWPVAGLDGQFYRKGPVTTTIMSALAAIGVMECA